MPADAGSAVAWPQSMHTITLLTGTNGSESKTLDYSIDRTGKYLCAGLTLVITNFLAPTGALEEGILCVHASARVSLSSKEHGNRVLES